MSNIIELTRKRLMDTIRAVQPVGKWKIIVVDSKSSQIINAACRMYDILEENVTLVENIERKRQAYPSLEAIYILTPCLESISRLVDDFSTQPMYKAAHVHFTSNLSDTMFSELNQKFKSSGVQEYVLGLKELYVDFMVSEASVFTVDPTPLAALFGTDRKASESRIRQIAKQLLSVFATLGQDPIIRYQSKSSICHQLAFSVQKEIEHFCDINPSFPPPQPRATLVILDRTIDMASPVLHEFTYQAMLNDLLPVKEAENKVGIQYTYHFHQSDDTLGSQEVTLDEEDDVYRSVRHMHIAQCSDHLIENFNQFLAENKVSGSEREKSTARNLKEMKYMLTNLPQFQSMKSKFSAHLNIAQECMSFFERHKLNSVGNLEQNMATFETADGETPKTVLLDMVPLLGDRMISVQDKTRLLILYLIWKEGKVETAEVQKLMDHAKLPVELRETVNNLLGLGIRPQRTKRKERLSFMKKRPEKEERPYELSRYVPVVKKVMETHFNEGLDPLQFESTKPKTGQEANGIASQGVSLRTTKSTWTKRNTALGRPVQNGAPLVVFVLGGISYAEIRSAYEIAESFQRDVLIGSTEILRPKEYLTCLGQLGHPVPLPVSVIPAYVPPRPEVNKQSSFISHLSPSYLSNRGSQVSLNSLATQTEEKKKKKGLKRLFG